MQDVIDLCTSDSLTEDGKQFPCDMQNDVPADEQYSDFIGQTTATEAENVVNSKAILSPSRIELFNKQNTSKSFAMRPGNGADLTPSIGDDTRLFTKMVGDQDRKTEKSLQSSNLKNKKEILSSVQPSAVKNKAELKTSLSLSDNISFLDAVTNSTDFEYAAKLDPFGSFEYLPSFLNTHRSFPTEDTSTNVRSYFGQDGKKKKEYVVDKNREFFSLLSISNEDTVVSDSSVSCRSDLPTENSQVEASVPEEGVGKQETRYHLSAKSDSSWVTCMDAVAVNAQIEMEVKKPVIQATCIASTKPMIMCEHENVQKISENNQKSDGDVCCVKPLCYYEDNSLPSHMKDSNRYSKTSKMVLSGSPQHIESRGKVFCDHKDAKTCLCAHKESDTVGTSLYRSTSWENVNWIPLGIASAGIKQQERSHGRTEKEKLAQISIVGNRKTTADKTVRAIPENCDFEELGSSSGSAWVATCATSTGIILTSTPDEKNSNGQTQSKSQKLQKIKNDPHVSLNMELPNAEDYAKKSKFESQSEEKVQQRNGDTVNKLGPLNLGDECVRQSSVSPAVVETNSEHCNLMNNSRSQSTAPNVSNQKSRYGKGLTSPLRKNSKTSPFRALPSRSHLPRVPSSTDKWKALILLVPMRLGSECLNELYEPCIKNLLAHDSCIGIIGGRPKHSLYFIGFQGNYYFKISRTNYSSIALLLRFFELQKWLHFQSNFYC